MPKVIVLDDLSQEGLNLLQSAGNIEVVVRTGLKGDDLRNALLEADGAICRSGVKITGEVLAGNTRLRVIARAGVGVDNIDTKTAAQLGIVVVNTPKGNTVSTAELAIALMFALSRNLYPAYQSLVEGRWDRKKFMGSQLAGKTLGVIGMGRIGQAVAVRALALEMRVIGYDPFVSNERMKELGIEPVAAARDMLPMIDYLTVHTVLNDETRNLIGPKEVPMLKPGVRLINCARGGIYDEQALAEGLRSGRIGGVALDVYTSEPCTNSPLFGMPNVLCTPHLVQHQRGPRCRGRRGGPTGVGLFCQQRRQAAGQAIACWFGGSKVKFQGDRLQRLSPCFFSMDSAVRYNLQTRYILAGIPKIRIVLSVNC